MITPRGSISLALAQLRTSLSESVEFQNYTGSQNAAEALERIRYYTVRDDADTWKQRPFALLKMTQRGSNSIGDGVVVELATGGSILLSLEDNAKHKESDDDSYIEFCNFAGSVMDDLEDNSGFNDHFATDQTDVLFGPERTPRNQREEQADFWQIVYVVNYNQVD